MYITIWFLSTLPIFPIFCISSRLRKNDFIGKRRQIHNESYSDIHHSTRNFTMIPNLKSKNIFAYALKRKSRLKKFAWAKPKNVGKFIALNPALCSVLVCCSLSRILCSFSIFNFSINLSESRSFFSTSRSFSSREKDSVEEDFFSASRRWMISSRFFVDFLLVYYF